MVPALLEDGSRTLQVWTGIDGIPERLGPTAVALGQFDGVHRGHQRLLHRARRAADEQGTAAGVVTFARHTSALLAPEREPLRLTDLDEKLALFALHGMDFAVVLPVTRAVLGMPAERFVSDLLLDRLTARTVVVGPDFRFGHRAAGDPGSLAEWTRPAGVEVVVADVLVHDGERVSSTRIREAVAQGRVAEAAALLGRSHRIAAEVAASLRGGDLLLAVDAAVACPTRGSYQVRVHPTGAPGRFTPAGPGRAVLTGAPAGAPGDRLAIDLIGP